MTFEFRDAKRQNISLLILLAGGTGGGKTESAMRLATGLAEGKPFAVIDTENGRALHKADDYRFKHTSLDEPFTPERYTEAVKAADEAGFPVIVVDSGSHEYEGMGGVLDIQADEFARMGGKESARMASWIAPKMRHKAFVQQLLRTRAHVILCLRAEDKIEIVKDEQGKTIVRPKTSLTGTQGWMPITEKRLPFEATISLLLLADNPGVPVPVKLEERHRALVPLDERLSEETGRLLGEWARGGTLSEPSAAAQAALDPAGGSESVYADEADVPKLLELAAKLGPEARETAAAKILTHRSKHQGKVLAKWLTDYTAAVVAKLEIKPIAETVAEPAFRVPEKAGT